MRSRSAAVPAPVAAPPFLPPIPTAICSKRAFNSIKFGCFLMYSGVRPMIDGRSVVYPDDYFMYFREVEQGAAGGDAQLDLSSVAISSPSSSCAGPLWDAVSYAHCRHFSTTSAIKGTLSRRLRDRTIAQSNTQ